MSSTPLPKRRRLGTSSSISTSSTPSSSKKALSQPFKSPFKTPLKPAPTTTTSTSTSTTSTTSTSTTNTILPPPSSPAATIPSSFSTSSSSPSLPSLLTLLQSQHTALLAQVSASRARLETCIQAQKLEASGSGSSADGELKGLVRAWKGASRAAAEEVFEGVRARVLGMGGWRAWREMQRGGGNGNGNGRGWGWEEVKGGEGKTGDGDEESGNEEEEGGEEEKGEEDEEEEQEFTMGMMLQSLSIELDVIGYDKAEQKWVD